MESPLHRTLVDLTVEYFRQNVPKDSFCFIEIDREGCTRPHKVGCAVPDVRFKWQTSYLIGEAKTIADFDKSHSREQYCSYLDELKWYNGESALVVAVPFQISNDAFNYFKHLKDKEGYLSRVVILDNFNIVRSV